MADTQTQVLVMTFEQYLHGKFHKKKSIRVANPVDNLDGQTVHKFMKNVSDNKMFWCDGRDSAELKPFNSKIVTTNTKNVELVSIDE